MTDFGLTLTVHRMSSGLATRPQGYTPGWAAPEILMGTGEISQEGDIFAFAMIVIEVGPHVSPHLVVEVGNGWFY